MNVARMPSAADCSQSVWKGGGLGVLGFPYGLRKRCMAANHAPQRKSVATRADTWTTHVLTDRRCRTGYSWPSRMMGTVSSAHGIQSTTLPRKSFAQG